MKQTLIPRIQLLGLALLFTLTGSAIVTAGTADLRGYGKVSTTISAEHAEFVCANAAKADILLGKLLADLFWDAGKDHLEKTDTVAGSEMVVHMWRPFGALVAGRDGNTVLVVGGRDEQEALAAAGKDRRFFSKTFQFKPSKPYPMYLDFFDLRAWKSETKGLYRGNKYQNDVRMQFINAVSNGGLMQCIAFGGDMAPGVNPQLSVMDTDIDIAAKQHQMVSVSIGTGSWPAWARNRWPELLEQDSPDSPANSFYGAPCAALGIQPEELRRSNLTFLKSVIERYKNSDAFGGMELYCGDYGCETFFSKARQGRFGYTATGEKAFRSWLRDKRKFSLKDLGERWYGDPARFKDWNEVRLPESPDSFFGDLNDQCLRIKDHWFWMLASESLNQAPDDSAPGWLPTPEAPSRTAFLTANPQAKPAFWRVAFNGADWLKQNRGKEVWLVCNTNNASSKDFQVWLNGKPLVQPESLLAQEVAATAVKVTGLLASGENLLVLAIHGGQIRGPVFLTTTEPRPYPYLGKHQNARYVDFLGWQFDAFNSIVIGSMEYARSLDPDRPFVIDPTNLEVKDVQGDALARLGGSAQDTGNEASFRPFNSRLGYAAGFYGSCEPAGYIPTKEPGNWPETRMLSQMLLNGEGHFRMTGDPSYFYEIEKNSHWCETNRRAMDLVGKSLPEKPQLAIFASSQNALLGDSGRGLAEWGIGRGELNSCCFDNVYVTESMLAKGIADDYPVLFDSNTAIMSPQTIKEIRKYVEKGGTFVALHQTDRHDILEPDSWPISELTGFKVGPTGEKGQITFANNLPIFKGWEGKQFEGEGSAINWKDEESAKGVSLSLTPAAPDAIPLAKWADGTTAVGMRTIGKGRIIVLGSTFWRAARDQGGTGIWVIGDVEQEALNKLFTDLGVQRTATSSDKRVYARKMISKNGLQDWLVLLNSTGNPRKQYGGEELKVDAGFAAAQRPVEVVDLVDRKPVAFEYANGWVTLKDVVVPPSGRRVFAAPRADLAGGLDFWWKEKTKFWKSAGMKPIRATEEADKSNPPVISFDHWKFYADTENTVGKSTAWAAPSFSDANWRDLNNTPWNFQYADLKDYSGVGLYRSRPFAIPSAWNNHRVTVNVELFRDCFKGIELYLNGTAVAGVGSVHRKFDITDQLKKRGNVLAIKLTGTAPISGLYRSAVWVQPEISLSPSVSLLGEWNAVKVNSLDPEKVTVTATDRALTDHGYLFDKNHKRLEDEHYVTANHLAVKAYRLVRDIDIPAQWQGKNVYVRIDSPQMNSQKLPICGLCGGMLVINNQPVSFSSPPNTPLDGETINLTPYIKFGQKNRIEIWPRSTLIGSNQDSLIVINNIDLGCEAK